VPEQAYTVPFGEASLVREGEHVTVVAIARMVPFAERAIDALAKEGISCDLIDPRTTSPLDEDTIIESVQGTGRLVIVDESPPRCGMASDIAAIVAQKAFRSLKRPIIQVTPPHTPIPFAPALERLYVPGPPRIEAAIRQAMKEA
jgi:acetoin:2,6-dichlorophenolindophenol oxidoreductase subunit beta